MIRPGRPALLTAWLALAGFSCFHQEPAGPPGTAFQYRIRYESKTEEDLSSLAGDKRTKSLPVVENEATVTGTLEESDVRQDGTSRIVRVRLIDPNVVIKGALGESPAAQASISKDLSLSVFMRIANGGEIQTVWYDPAAASATQTFLRSILSLFQYNLEPVKGKTWFSLEDDSAGRCRVRFTTDGPGKKLKKLKIGYVATWAPDDPLRAPQVPNSKPISSAEFTLDPEDDTLKSASVQEVTSSRVGSLSLADARTTASLEFLKKQTETSEAQSKLLTDFQARSGSSKGALLFQTARPQEVLSQTYQKLAEGVTFEALQHDLATADASGKPVNATSPVYARLKAFLFTQPNSAEEFGTLLAKGNPQAASSDLISSALSTVGWAPAQAALILGMTAQPSSKGSQKLIFLLSRTPDPSPETETYLRKLAFDPAFGYEDQMAYLALGTLARTVSADDPARADKIVADLVSGAGPSPDINRAGLLLSALGNAGRDSSLPAVRPYLSSTDANLRARAAIALREMTSPESEQLLSNLAKSDPNPQIRVIALKSWSSHTMSDDAFAAQTAIMTGDSDQNVRFAAMQNIWSARLAYPEAVDHVKKASLEDSSKDLKKKADELLAKD